MIKKGLGKGLEALIPNISVPEKEIRELKINTIDPNAEQPRKYFNQEELNNLAESIKIHGVVQPIIVTEEKGRYKIIAGERRWRAARLANMKTIPAIVKEYADKQALEVALIENIQRQDLNAIEEAEAFKKLVEEYNLKQEEIACSVGKSRSAITNSLRLLSLDKRIQEMVSAGRITEGHARALLGLKDKDEQYDAARMVEKDSLNVREIEEYIRKKSKNAKVKNKRVNKAKYIENDISDKLKNILGTKVNIETNKNKGKIIIEYYSTEELERILEMFYRLN